MDVDFDILNKYYIYHTIGLGSYITQSCFWPKKILLATVADSLYLFLMKFS